MKRYITRAGAERLRAEHQQLWNVERRRVVQEVQAAAAQGDRSENAEYIYGKKRLREIDKRLEFLEKTLAGATVVEPEARDTDRVFFGAFVTVEDEDGARTRYQLVGPDEFDAAAGRISIESPLGRALLGRRTGDTVSVRRPRGDVELTVAEVRYEAPPG